jgi:hypothetical protein
VEGSRGNRTEGKGERGLSGERGEKEWEGGNGDEEKLTGVGAREEERREGEGGWRDTEN